MTKFCIIRHGETDWNAKGIFQGIEDIPLNQEGRKQALHCVNYLKNYSWSAIISSPLSRAKETAQIIGKELGIDNVQIKQDFIERDLGEASGLSPEERHKRFPDNNIKSMEPRSQVVDRISKALNELVQKYPNDNVIVVTHGGVLNALMYYVSGGTFDPNMVKTRNGGITVVNYECEKWETEMFNFVEQ